MTDQQKFIEGLRKAWADEIRSARSYAALAEREKNPERKTIFERMAQAEERHAETWAKRLKELGVETGMYKESFLERLRRKALLNSDTDTAARMLEEGERDADGLYDQLLSSSPTEEDRAALVHAMLEERSHSKMLEEFQSSPHPSRGKLEKILGREKWHVRSGGWIGQAIYGVNDGLGAAFGVVSGVAGATHANGEFVLLSGFATMIASALSMGSGAYLATKSEREVYQAEMDRERDEIELNPEEEREELELFYQLKGFSEEEAKTLTARLANQPDQFLKMLAHEELGLSEQSFPNEWRSAFSAMISTAIGAVIPVLPFVVTSGTTALILSLAISTIAHFVVGASKVIVTGRSWLKSGMEMTLIGLGEAAITYLIGLLISPAIG
ncbi:MAG TPA: VIT1/CCC1 transporter family protein [Bacteroidota bacterium]|nr:VIT1/CCC1 transporter family protein [Bacteroidota bacterium]